jgi:predicted nuclease of predicted toxin-antitoxin system
MKLLLFDENLSRRLVSRLADVFPGSQHVALVGLETATDREVWEYARDNGFILTTKDSDFNELLLLWGFPPKIVWIQRGNCSTSDIEQLLRENAELIEKMEADADTGIFTIS